MREYETPVIKRGTSFSIGGLKVSVRKICRESVIVNLPDDTWCHLLSRDIERALTKFDMAILKASNR